MDNNLVHYHILVGFGSKRFFPVSTHYSAPGSAYPNFGYDTMVQTSGNQAQGDYSRDRPATLPQQSSDPNAKGTVFPKRSFPASTHYSAPGSAYPNFGYDTMVQTSGKQAQGDYSRDRPSTWPQQSSDPNAKGTVYPNRDSTNAGSSGWVKNSGLDSYYIVPDGREGNSKELQTLQDEDLEEDPEEESVLSEVSDLEPVYSISSRSRYRHGRRVFVQTSYTPGEVMAAHPAMPVSKGKPAGPQWSGKGFF